MRKVYLTKLYVGPANSSSCTPRKLELDTNAGEASGDQMRIAMTSATRGGKNLGPTALRNGLSRVISE